jgi:hypothetical protein
MNWKGSGRKRSWSNVRYNTDISVEKLSKTTKNLSQGSRFTVRDLNPGSPEYERRSVLAHNTCLYTVACVLQSKPFEARARRNSI